MKSIAIWIAKKYAISAINDVFKKYDQNITKISEQIGLWTGRLQKIIDQLYRINERVKDADLTQEEVEQSIDEIERLIREF